MALGLRIRALGVSTVQVGLPRAGMGHACIYSLRTLTSCYPFFGLSFPTFKWRGLSGHGDLEGLRELICVLEPQRGVRTVRSVTAGPCPLYALLYPQSGCKINSR